MVFKPGGKKKEVKVMFENDVKEYGFQTQDENSICDCAFENDVKEYGFQTFIAV